MIHARDGTNNATVPSQKWWCNSQHFKDAAPLTCSLLVPVPLPPQEELEAYERYQRQLEDQLDAKTAELIALRKVGREWRGRGGVAVTLHTSSVVSGRTTVRKAHRAAGLEDANQAA